MNCKPGDLAVVIHGQMSLGRIVRTVRMLSVGELVQGPCGTKCRIEGGPQWLLEGLVYRKCGDGKIRLLPAVVDASLRPIRDPGDDAKDEMLRPLPKKATA